MALVNLNSYVEASISNLSFLQSDAINREFYSAVQILTEAIKRSGNILICGNGGSHADAQHFAGELVNYFTKPHRALSVIALGTNTAVATAWSNDHDFQEQFAREVEAYGNSASVLIGITTSGKSRNINNAFIRAQELGLQTIAITSEKALSLLPPKIDCKIAVPVSETHKIQECHIVIYHAICIAVDEVI